MPRLTKRLVDAAGVAKGELFSGTTSCPGLACGSSERRQVLPSAVSQRQWPEPPADFGTVWRPDGRGGAQGGKAGIGRCRKGRRSGREQETRPWCHDDRGTLPGILDQGGGRADSYPPRRGKSESTLYTDTGRINRHIIPLIGKRTVKDFTAIDAGKFQREVIAGKSAADIKTKLRGRAIVTGGKGTAARTMGLLGGIFSYAAVRAIGRTTSWRHRRPKDERREWRLDDAGYRQLGKCLATAEANGEHWQRILASRAATLTGCRLDEVEGLLKTQVDPAGMALRLGKTKGGKSIRPVGSAVIAVLQSRLSQVQLEIRLSGNHDQQQAPYRADPLVTGIAAKEVPEITCHGLRHSFSSTAEDLGFSIPTIKALVGHCPLERAEGYIHKINSALLTAADRIARHIDDAMTGRKVKQGRPTRKA